jgi:hypothetical protein
MAFGSTGVGLLSRWTDQFDSWHCSVRRCLHLRDVTRESVIGTISSVEVEETHPCQRQDLWAPSVSAEA